MTLTARDVMQTRVISVSPDETIADLEQILLSNRVSGVPVVEDEKLVGVVSRSDFLRLLSRERSLADTQLDFYRQFEDDPDAPSEVMAREMQNDVEDAAAIVARRMAGLHVRDAMVHAVVGVAPDTELAQVARTLVERRIHRVVVVDDGRLAGIVSTLDLVRLIADGRVS